MPVYLLAFDAEKAIIEDGVITFHDTDGEKIGAAAGFDSIHFPPDDDDDDEPASIQ